MFQRSRANVDWESTLDDHAPLKTRTVKLQSESPWFNDDDIRAAMKTRRQLERKWRDNGKREVHRQEYRKQHDIVKNMINRAKIAHYSSLVEESSGNQKNSHCRKAVS